MKIALCQISSKIGGLRENADKIEKYYKQAQRDSVDICIFPELSITGYLVEDLFLNSEFIKNVNWHVNRLIKITNNSCLPIPAPIFESGKLYNGVIFAQNQKIIAKTYKCKLPNYGIFDEYRYFTPSAPQIISINGVKIGVPICEDIWSDYVCDQLKKQGAELLISVNASPFERGKIQKRIKQVEKIFNNTELPIIYCNMVGAQDGIVFDGNSFCFDGNLKMVCNNFSEEVRSIKYINNKLNINNSYNLSNNHNDEIYKAIILGTKSYVEENNFSKVILGLSGGLDSSMVAQIAVDAFGPENVSALMLPSEFTSNQSIDNAKIVADILGISLKIIPINDLMNSFTLALNNSSMKKSSIAHQNLQSRIRGVILMAESNNTGAMLLSTGNKSELATGYTTLYGDSNGGFNPIKDLYKTELYELARYTNIIPEHIINAEPSAELTSNQKDSDSLPEYNILDQILLNHIEYDKGEEELSRQFDQDLVKRVIKLVKTAQFKRMQVPPGVKLSIRNFEKDRRLPITNHYY